MHCLIRFVVEATSLKPCVLHGFRNLLKVKKTTFGVRFGSVLDPPEPKTMYFTMFFNDFTRFVFVLQKYRKRLRGSGSMGQVGARVASLGPDSTDHNTPSRTDDRNTFA